jgi:hypothetical protein
MRGSRAAIKARSFILERVGGKQIEIPRKDSTIIPEKQ